MTTLQTTLRKYALNITNRDVLLIMSGFALGTALGSLVLGSATGSISFITWLEGFLQNFSTEMFGGFVTFLLIEVLIVTRKEREASQRRRKEAEQERLKQEAAKREDLLHRLSSRVNSEAMRASEELRYCGWIEDGTLDDCNVTGADLQNCNFARARMRRVRFHRAILREASFYRADLQGAYLVGVDASEAIFRGADLSGAYLQGANLTGAAGLTPQQLATAARLKGATMPDGTRYDGRYNLRGDTKKARDKGHDPEYDERVAEFYGVPLEVYLEGQRWAKENL
jgi:hypothetical protein